MNKESFYRKIMIYIFSNYYNIYRDSTFQNSHKNYVNRKYYLILHLLYKLYKGKIVVFRKVILYSAQVNRNEQICIVFSWLRVHPSKNNLQTLYINIVQDVFSPSSNIRSETRLRFSFFVLWSSIN